MLENIPGVDVLAFLPKSFSLACMSGEHLLHETSLSLRLDSHTPFLIVSLYLEPDVNVAPSTPECMSLFLV